jgi:hypothetical protein
MRTPPRHAAIAAALAAAALVPASAQEVPLLDLLVERLGMYLTEYEATLGALVADERYYQEEMVQRRRQDGLPATRRRIESEVGFLPLPGEVVWFGVRDVRRVDGKAVTGSGISLSELFTGPGSAFVERARAIVEASARHNLGPRRTINMPTVPLEALSARNHPRFIFTLRGTDRVRGTRTRRLDFEEFDEPTLVQGSGGENLWSRGSAWIDPETGAVWRAEIIVGPDQPGSYRRVWLESKVRVEFERHAELSLLVPVQLNEEFWSPFGRGSGRATYTNFRRFGTSARIVPR